jgi:hypothetical protein
VLFHLGRDRILKNDWDAMAGENSQIRQDRGLKVVVPAMEYIGIEGNPFDLALLDCLKDLFFRQGWHGYSIFS